MQPNQPQQPIDPMTPQPAAPPSPAPDPVAAPVQPVPPAPNSGMPANPMPQSVPSPSESISPTPPSAAIPPAPVVPAQPVAEPAPMPAPAVSMATPPSSPTSQPQLDSSQPGYVPPANPTPIAPMTGNASNKTGGKFGKARLIIAIVVALFFFLGGGLLLKDVLFSGSKITKDSLVDAKEAGVAFKHPEGWSKVESTVGSADAIYTENGTPLKETDQSIQLLAESLPVNIDDLSDAEMAQLGTALEKEMSDTSDYEDVGCKNPEGLTVNKTTKENYKIAYTAEVTCSGYEGRNVKLRVKVTLAAGGEEAHTVWIFALDQTWDKSGEALDEILNTFKPAE